MKSFLKGAALAGGAILAVKALDTRLEVTSYEVKSDKIPKSFDGYKIIHLSDYHNDTVPELIWEIRDEHPDMIVCTGDMADDKGTYIPALRLTEKLTKIAPCYMVTGNHDLWRSDFEHMETEMQNSGAIFLHNERVIISKEQEQIALSGIDDPFYRGNSKIKPYLSEAAGELCGFDGFNMLLFHRANLLDEFLEYGFDLILSGHMHGGHVRIPGIGGVASPRSSWQDNENILFPKYLGGMFKSGETTMIVNRGLGNPTFIPRVFNRPEMIIITLRAL